MVYYMYALTKRTEDISTSFQYLLGQDSPHRCPFCSELQLLVLSRHVHFESVDLPHLWPTPSDSQDDPRMQLCARLYNL